jgi:YHS domain-containing protein
MKRIFTLVLVLVASNLIFAQGNTETVFSDASGAIRGYDPVAYFTESQALKGDKNISYEYLGTTWHFINEEHKELFIADPEKYLPQYGGYCAWAMANGDFASIDPEAWTIVEDKLYLNFSNRIKARFDKDTAGFIESADGHWEEFLKSTD